MKTGDRKPPPKNLVDAFEYVSTSTIGTVMDRMGIDGIANGLKCLIPGVRIAGAAFTVKALVGPLGTYSRTDFPVGQVIDLTQSGDVLVVDMNGEEVSTMGGLGSLAMKLKGVKGIVVDGGVRDAEEICEVGFPAYVAHVCAKSGQGRVKYEAINVPVKVRSVTVNPGDIVVADYTSVAVVPAQSAEGILREAQDIERAEKLFQEELRKGVTFQEVAKRLQCM